MFLANRKPMLPVRSSQLAQGMANPRSAPGVEPRTWADAVARTLNAERVVPGYRIMGTAKAAGLYGALVCST